MCMHAQEVLFQIRSMKKPVMFFKNDHKKIVFITTCNEKQLFETYHPLKNLSASPNNGNPPPPR